MTNDNAGQFQYDVALSFAGEDRATVDQFAQILDSKNIKYFYDEAEAPELWGKDLIAHLADVYENQARYCVMFISKNYPLKKWTNFERTHIQARAFRDTNEYILPIRLDDTQVPGIAETLGYRDIRQHSLESIADVLEHKLAKVQKRTGVISALKEKSTLEQQMGNALFGSIPMPKQAKLFTQYQKDQFAVESFNVIKIYFQEALKQLQGLRSDIQTDFFEVNSREFTCKIYIHETLKCQCKIWLGENALASNNAICYNENANMMGHNSMNDYLSVEDNGEELRLRIGMGALGIGFAVEEPLANQQKAAEYLWRRLISRLEYR